ncbi:flippase [Cryobacterium sp. TMT1-21]|nr:flippase [Cryobacterium sp. TmT2-59]TFD14065.1 flippase [Cryobacterium sp. TMT4-10]TFD17663.1 flippase [Cryobacterium sp. TMT1-21]TFD22660.1 flippase [Cryobacterium sp. TMT2-23]TFD36245.1 flippase [Cryobacterium sp. TMT2-10]
MAVAPDARASAACLPLSDRQPGFHPAARAATPAQADTGHPPVTEVKVGVIDNSSGKLAREGAAGFLGAATSAFMGFVLTVVLARVLGDTGSGVILQAIAVFTIVLSLARAGMDSVAVWIMPRLSANDPSKIRGTLAMMFLVTAACGIVCAIGMIALAPTFALSGDRHAADVAQAIAAAGWFLPAGALMLVALAATRGLGGVLPYVSVGSIAMPSLRTGGVWLVAIAGGSLVAVTVAWAAPVVIALVAALVVLGFQVRRHERAAGLRGVWRVQPALRTSVVMYALPRVLSAGLEQSILWLGILIVGFLAGSASAGVYGGASRLVAAGFIVDTALRIVVSTRFSALLFAKKFADIEHLYRTAAIWLVLISTPIYVVLAAFAPVVLRLLGPGFEAGAGVLVILCVGAVLTFTAGNIHSVLLMSGRSGWAAFNKAVVLVINVLGNVILVPLIGINGAAISWALSMLIDAMLAAAEVRHFIGIRIWAPTIAYALVIPIATFGIPALILLQTLGETMLALVLTLAIGAALFLVWCALDRKRLHLTDLVRFTRA